MIPLGFLKGVPSPVQYIGNAGKYVNGADGSAITITFNGSTQEGDYLMCVTTVDDATSTNTPTGWNLIYDRGFPPYSKTRIFSKTYASADGNTVYVDPGFGQVTASVLTFRGVGSVSGFANNGVEPVGSTLTIAGGTSTEDNVFTIFGFGHDAPKDIAIASNWTNANISSASELIDISTSNHYDGGFAVWGGYKLTAGATGNTTVTVDGSVQGTQTFGFFFYPT